MATEYTITYTYTGQSNTSGSRSVALSKFKKTGDTGRNIGQITSITYEHYHTATESMDWGLRGRLVLSDGTTFVSNKVTKHISGNIVKYSNTFATLPTAEQFALAQKIQTLDNNGSTGDSGYYAKLYWRATSAEPMKLIVKFIEEPPVTYAPKVDQFDLTRVNASGGKDDEGQYIGTTMKLSVGNSAGLTGAQCRVYYAADAYPEVGVSQYIDLTSKISTLVSGVAINTTILTGVWSLGNIWNFAVVFTTGEETAIATASVARGTVNFHISGEHGGGAAVGGFSSGTTANPKFESHVPGFFYAGINGVTNYSTSEVKTGGTWIDGKPIYTRVFEKGSVALSKGSYKTTIATIDNFSDIDKILDIFGFTKFVNQQFPLSRIFSTTEFHGVYIDASGNIVLRTVYSDTAITMEYIFAGIYYTKKTD